MSDYILELNNIGKTFSGVNVLRGINLKFKRGEVHALLGENGAGKSTLIKILSGYHQPDEGGTLIINGKEISFKNPKDAIDASIHTIYQELTLCPLMTVTENIVMDKQDNFKGILLKKKEHKKLAEEVLGVLGQSEIDPDRLVAELSIAERQVVEIAKAVSSEARILLMDEPTSSISQHDADKLMKIIMNLRDNGVTIIYISHRLHEISGIADRITVLRDGNLIDTKNNEDVDAQGLIKMMVGRELTNVYPKRDIALGETVLDVQGLCSKDTFNDITFSVKRGEIFGIGGLVGSKRTELLEALFGLRPITGGRILLNGEDFIPNDPRNAIKHRIAFITEDRKKSGLVLCLPVYENISMLNAQKKTKLGYLNWQKFITNAEQQKEALNIKLNSITQVVNTLSGGNQQKVVLAKWIDFKPEIVLFDEPTRGIDVGTKTEIYDIMGNMAENGAAVIMVSSELPELISVADNILVMRDGKMEGILTKEEASQEKVMAMATGQKN